MQPFLELSELTNPIIVEEICVSSKPMREDVTYVTSSLIG